MGNNNTTASLLEEESSKLKETNGMSPLEPVSVETTQDQLFLASEDKDGDKRKESLLDGKVSNVTQETEPQSRELLVEDPKLKNVKEEIHQSGLVMKTDKHLQKQTLVAEEESSKIEDTNGMTPLESVSMETTQDQVFLAIEGKDGDDEKETLLDGTETQETKPQSMEVLVEDTKAKNVEEAMLENGLESTYEELQKQTSVPEEVEIVCEELEMEVLTLLGTQSVVSKLNTTEFGNEEKPCVIDETVFEKMINEFKEDIVPANEVVKLDQETGLEQRTMFVEMEPQEILNLDNHVVDDEEEVTNEEKSDQLISKFGSQESNAIHETGLGVYEEGKDMETRREKSVKRMSRCRSLPVSHNSREIGDSLVQNLVSKVTFPPRNKTGLAETPNTSETLLVTCVRSNKEQEASEAVNEINKEARLEMRSPSFGNELRTKEKSDESTEKTPLLDEVKIETYEATIDVEEKTVMLKRSESEKARGIEMSLGLSMKPKEGSKGDDRFKETKGLGDNLQAKKASLGTMQGRVRRRSKSSILGTCLCCATAMN